MLKYPFDEAFQSQQPLVLIGGAVLAKTGSPPAAAILETAAGVQHSLGVLGHLDSLWNMASRRLATDAEIMLRRELPRQVTELRTDALAYFVEYLAPAFELRDFSEQPLVARSVLSAPTPVDWSREIKQVARALPAPEVAQPSLWMLGRAWRLREGVAKHGCWQIHMDARCYSLSGDFSFVSTLATDWQHRVVRLVKVRAVDLASRMGEPQATTQARQELKTRGCLERGDLVLLSGSPPLLGHVIPAHYNRTLNRSVSRDLLIAAPLALPNPAPVRTGLSIHERVAHSWKLISPPHGLCLGPDPPMHAQDSPGIGLAAFLRWAAQRIAGNGVFHSSDDSDSTAYDAYQY